MTREGPNLHGVFGRKVAEDTSYLKYSLASMYKDITWNEDNLMRFLEDPKKFIPGTKMLFKGLKSVEQRTGKLGTHNHHCLHMCVRIAWDYSTLNTDVLALGHVMFLASWYPII